MLDIRPAAFGDSGEIEAVARPDEVDLVPGQGVRRGVGGGALGQRDIGSPRTSRRLLGLDCRCERKVEEALPHGGSPDSIGPSLDQGVASFRSRNSWIIGAMVSSLSSRAKWPVSRR